MHSNVAVGKHRRRVRFPSRKNISPANGQHQPPQQEQQQQQEQPQPQQKDPGSTRPSSWKPRIQKQKKSSNTGAENMASSAPEIDCQPGVPPLFTQLPKLRDQLTTETSKSQDETLDICLPFLKGVGRSQNGPFNEFGVPRLNKGQHLMFVYDALEDYPGRFVGLDASKPWMIYWAITALYLLGEDVGLLRKRCVFVIYPTTTLPPPPPPPIFTTRSISSAWGVSIFARAASSAFVSASGVVFMFFT